MNDIPEVPKLISLKTRAGSLSWCQVMTLGDWEFLLERCADWHSIPHNRTVLAAKRGDQFYIMRNWDGDYRFTGGSTAMHRRKQFFGIEDLKTLRLAVKKGRIIETDFK
jgi:hypothetical protein